MVLQIVQAERKQTKEDNYFQEFESDSTCFQRIQSCIVPWIWGYTHTHTHTHTTAQKTERC